MFCQALLAALLALAGEDSEISRDPFCFQAENQALARPQPSLRRDSPLYNTIADGKPYLTYDLITSLPNLPQRSHWFTAAVIACIHSDPLSLQGPNNITADAPSFTYWLHDPVTRDVSRVEVKRENVNMLGNETAQWWGAGLLQAMNQHGLWATQSGGGRILGASNGFWSNGTGFQGLQLLQGADRAFVYATRDKEKIKQIAKIAIFNPVTVTTNKGLVTTSSGFQGDTSDGDHEYAVLGLKDDGGIMIKGVANRLESDGMVSNTDDLASHVVLFSSTVDLAKALG